MAKKYKLASEKTIKAGKGISTDKLSFDEALGFFKQQGKERRMNRFRYQGKVYDLSGKEIPAASAKKTSTVTQKKVEPKTYSGRGDGSKEVTTRKRDTMKYSGRGEGAKDAAPKKESPSSTMIPAAGASVRGRGSRAAGKPYNPNYTGKSAMAEGFQGKYGGEVAKARGSKSAGKIGSSTTNTTKPSAKPTTSAVGKVNKPRISAPPKALPPPETGFKGQTPEFMKRSMRGAKAAGVNPSKVAKRTAKGGRRSSMQNKDDFNPFLN